MSSESFGFYSCIKGLNHTFCIEYIIYKFILKTLYHRTHSICSFITAYLSNLLANLFHQKTQKQ